VDRRIPEIATSIITQLGPCAIQTWPGHLSYF